MAYIGKKEAYPIIIDGLKKLEYRGYDSAGVAIMNGSLSLYKKQGKVTFLEDFTDGKKTNGNLAMGHTRWATHGIPSDYNAHPHTSQSGRLVMVHNGIIENYEFLKTLLKEKGFNFKSDTDSEVLVQFIEWYQVKYALTLKEAVRRALQDVEGTYAIVIMDTIAPNKIIVAKKENPLAIGLADDGFYIASDAGPMSKYTSEVIYLNDEEVGELNIDGSFSVIDLENNEIASIVTSISKSNDNYDKGSFDSYMLKEIFQQPDTIKNCISTRLDVANNNIDLKAVDEHKRLFKNTNRIIIVGCGTSWHAGLIGEYLIEALANVSVEVEYASEFRYRNPVINQNDIVIAISQSGETADTLAALKLANEKGAFTYSLVNTPESTIARHSDSVSYIKAGVEIGVASTKAFTGQVTLLTMLAIKLAIIKETINPSEVQKYIKAIHQLPTLVEGALKTKNVIKKIVKKLSNNNNALFLGRGLNFPVALEGALKLKEISYIH
ncbi:MAG: glutamine--fructose-6-phosphate transaminase (isomerizing), partial [Bacteroidia bacterium]|nr:glutamine--fructose-6-phosphate transaminase (isomerizing) [Bacteroidia bacterium]